MTIYRIYSIGQDRHATLRTEINATSKEALRAALLLVRSLPEGESCLLACDPGDDAPGSEPPTVH
jgi:hypothetical protein